MRIDIDPSDLQERGWDILVRELGVVDAIRFLNQYRAGGGDYTIERQERLRDLTVDQFAAEIRAKSPPANQ